MSDVGIGLTVLGSIIGIPFGIMCAVILWERWRETRESYWQSQIDQAESNAALADKTVKKAQRNIERIRHREATRHPEPMQGEDHVSPEVPEDPPGDPRRMRR